jgi:hypothetical protein
MLGAPDVYMEYRNDWLIGFSQSENLCLPAVFGAEH